MSNFVRRLQDWVFAAAIASWSWSALADDNVGLVDKEQMELQRELSWLTAIMWGLVVALILFAVAIRHIARRTTHPCRWCMEFISNGADVCPQCGKRAVKP